MVKPIGAWSRTADFARSVWANRRWVVLAPHQDDEAIGTGALIIDTARRGTLAGVVFLTDGAASHPDSAIVSTRRLAALRRREAAASLRILAGPRTPATFLDWPDAHPFRPGSPPFDRAARRLAAVLRSRGADALAVTASDEPHCDHEAAAQLAEASVALARRPVRIFFYGVWSSPALRAGYRCLRLDGRPVRALRQRALDCHRSQLTPVAGEGFRLTPLQADLRRRPVDLLFTKVFSHASLANAGS